MGKDSLILLFEYYEQKRLLDSFSNSAISQDFAYLLRGTSFFMTLFLEYLKSATLVFASPISNWPINDWEIFCRCSAEMRYLISMAFVVTLDDDKRNRPMKGQFYMCMLKSNEIALIPKKLPKPLILFNISYKTSFCRGLRDLYTFFVL